MAVKYNYNQVFNENNERLLEILNDATTSITTQKDLIEEIYQTLLNKSFGDGDGEDILAGSKYLWVKYDNETDDHIDIIELRVDTDINAFPEDGVGEDGFNYKRITHVLVGDSTNPAILEL